MADITFIPETHQYFCGAIEYISISEIIAPLGEDTPDDLELTIEAAAERGTTCHKILEMLLNGEDEIEYPSSYEGYVSAIRKFLSEHEIIPIAIETPIGSEKMRIAGTPDLLCYFDGILAILDYKFVAQVAKTKVKAQTNGYNEIFNENGVFPEELKVIQFLPDGNYRIYPVAMSSYEFYLCLDLYQAKNKKHPRGRID